MDPSTAMYFNSVTRDSPSSDSQQARAGINLTMQKHMRNVGSSATRPGDKGSFRVNQAPGSNYVGRRSGKAPKRTRRDANGYLRPSEEESPLGGGRFYGRQKTDYGSRHGVNNISLRPDVYTQTYAKNIAHASQEYNPNSFPDNRPPTLTEHKDLMRFIRGSQYINGVTADQMLSNGTLSAGGEGTSEFGIPIDFQRLASKAFGR